MAERPQDDRALPIGAKLLWAFPMVCLAMGLAASALVLVVEISVPWSVGGGLDHLGIPRWYPLKELVCVGLLTWTLLRHRRSARRHETRLRATVRWTALCAAGLLAIAAVLPGPVVWLLPDWLVSLLGHLPSPG